MSFVFEISVKELVDWVSRSGSIDNTFVSSNRNIEGINIHKYIQSTYAKQGFEKEVPLECSIMLDEFEIKLSGRADAILFVDEKYIIEEIKSSNYEIEDITLIDTHLSQAMCYGYMFCKTKEIDNIDIMVTYVNVDSLEKKTFQYNFTIFELENFIYSTLNKYLVFLRYIKEHQENRLYSCLNIKFPFQKVRKGQKDFAQLVYKTIKNKTMLIAQAPTGIGKTIGVLYPAIKSLANESIKKIFYLTPKETTKLQAKETMKLFLNEGLQINTLVLTSKEKICPKEIKRCNKDFCEYANCHYDRVNNAILDILSTNKLFDKETIEFFAKKHIVCPFEFSLDLSLFSDVIICDYNYVFDPMVYLRRFFDNNSPDYIFLVDEAHNLPERSRDMYSFVLKKEDILNVKNQFKHISQIKKQLEKINKVLLKYKKQCQNGIFISKQKPSDLLNALNSFVNTTQSILIKQQKQLNNDYNKFETLLNLFFDVIRFLRISEFFSENFAIICEDTGKSFSFKICCLDSSEFLINTLTRAQSSILFSATLIPYEFFRSYFTKNENVKYVKIKSPFNPANRLILIEGNTSTKYKDRLFTIDTVCKTIVTAVSLRQGNYMVFLPSYEYMELLIEKLPEFLNDNIEIVIQTQNMAEEEKIQFISKFSEQASKTVIGLSVLGGAFSESVDFDGDKLIGVIIIGVGLPQINTERNLIKSHFNNKGYDGFDYSYSFPGIVKVFQAIGRLIRTETDQGFVLLIDERYKEVKYKNLLFSNYENIKYIKNENELLNDLKSFWQQNGL